MANKNLNRGPIRIYIYDFNSEENKGSHAALEFEGEVIDYSSAGFSSRSDRCQHGCRVYEIEPENIGVDPDKLIKAIKQRKREIRGSDYNYLSQNCADQVMTVLRRAGATDLPDESGAHTAKPTAEGSVADVVKDAVNIPIIGDIAGAVASGIVKAETFITGQDALDEWCEANGRLAETRLDRDSYYIKLSEFNSCVKSFCREEQIKKACEELRNAELNGERADTDCLSKYDLIPAKTKAELKLMLINLPNNTPEEKAQRMKTYNDLITKAELSMEEAKQNAWKVYSSCSADNLLLNEMTDTVNEKAPALGVYVHTNEALAESRKREISDKIENMLGIKSKRIEDTEIKRNIPSPNVRDIDSNLGRS